MRPPFSITDKMLKLTVEITQAVTLLELQHQRDFHIFVNFCLPKHFGSTA